MALTKSDRPWLLTALAVAVSLGFAVSNATRSAEEAWMVLDFASRIIGPLGAACIAWLGVSQTLDNSQKLDRVKELFRRSKWKRCGEFVVALEWGSGSGSLLRRFVCYWLASSLMFG
ncbi:hypothetical protein ACUY3P_09615, partial [Corynebacterium lehmanniae]